MIRRVLLTLNVNDFSDMNNIMIWVHGEGEGLGFTPKGISRLKCDTSDNEPLIFDNVYEEFKSYE